MKTAIFEYIDACALVRETEEEIQALEKRMSVAHDRVAGSMPEFPYAATHFNVSGIAGDFRDMEKIEEEKRKLEELKESAEKKKLEAEAEMNLAPLRMRRVIRYRVFQGMSWEQVAECMGKGATGESIRKEFDRFVKK